MKINRTLQIIIAVVILLIALRIALPHATKHYLNKKLNEIEDYHASIEEVNMALYRGAFLIGGLEIYEEESADPDIPFVVIPGLDFSIHWGALFNGRFVTEIYINSAEINFTKLEEDVEGQEPREHFADQIQELNPIDINILEISNATIAYRDPTVSPEVNVFFDDFYLTGRNLSNVVDENEALPASIEVTSKAMDTGSMDITAGLNFLKEVPDFDLSVSFEEIEMVRFNDFMEAYASLDLESGLLSVYSETVAEDGSITGYVKPVIENFEINQDDDEGIAQQVYEAAAELVANILENPPEDRIASRVEISGEIEEFETSTWQGIVNLLRNAFIEAYSKEIENVIQFGEENEDENAQ